MSVLVISRQMVADAVKTASRFTGFTDISRENSLCPVLGKMSCKEREEFFLRLFFYNHISYDVRYGETWTTTDVIEDEWENTLKRGNEVSIYQFLNILFCLDYNIEFKSMRDAGFRHPKFRSDEKLLAEVIEILKTNIIRAEMQKRSVPWTY